MKILEERKSTWLELFYDLVIVVVIAAISQYLLANFNVRGFGNAVYMLMLTWWIWIGFTYYLDLTDFKGWPLNIVIFIIMLATIFFAISIKYFYDINYFYLSYTILRMILLVLYFLILIDKKKRGFALIIVVCFSIAMIFRLIAVFTNNYEIRAIFWAIAFIIELLAPILSFSISYIKKTIPYQNSHLDERYGLLVLIVMGEVIAIFSNSIIRTSWDAHKIIVCLFSFFILTLFWWLYFYHEEKKFFITSGMLKKNIALLFIHSYSHTILFLSLISFGVGLEIAITGHGNIILSKLIYGLGMAGMILSIILTKHPSRMENYKYLLYVLCSTILTLSIFTILTTNILNLSMLGFILFFTCAVSSQLYVNKQRSADFTKRKFFK